MATFTIYKTAPQPNTNRVPWYTQVGHSAYGYTGLSTCIIPPRTYWNGCTYANCVGYAIGRYCEIHNDASHFPKGKVGDAKGIPSYYRKLGYDVSTQVKTGSMIVWNVGESGHVAFVERVYNDGTFDITEGNYGTNHPAFDFQGKIRTSRYSNYIGCVHPKIEFDVELPPVTTVYDGYITDTQMYNNALNFASFLKDKGWTLEAISGLLGNMHQESGLNSGAVEHKSDGSVGQGRGLIQWTPLSVLTTEMSYMNLSGSWQNWINQLTVIDGELKGTSGTQTWYDRGYNMSGIDYLNSTQSPEYLAEVYAMNRERAGTVKLQNRTSWARKFYNFLKSSWDNIGGYPEDSHTSQTGSEMGTNIFMMIRKKEWYE